jgi:hypothetical protein
MPMRLFLICLLLAPATFAQSKYSGPKPPKPDLPYIVHADNLVSTEAGEAKEQKGKKKDDITYVVPGAASSARTPLASPIFLMQAEQVAADKLQVYKLTVKNGQREITFSKKNKQAPIIVNVVPLGVDNLFRLEIDQTLQPGEYVLTPEGSNQVFCFAVF